MLLAVATDTTYLPWCATAVLSALEVTPARSVEVAVLHAGDLDHDAQQRFGAMVEGAGASASFHAIDDADVAHLPSKGPDLGGRTSWFRVLLPALLPGHGQALYLDADVLAVSSLEPLWSTDLGSDLFAAVPNIVDPSMVGHVEGLGLDARGGYFNAGVLLMNLEQMRTDDTAGAVAAFTAEHGATPWFDQDALNVVGAGRWLVLDPRWNAQNSFWFWKPLAAEVFGTDVLRRSTADPAILHFEGPGFMKPWHYPFPHPFVGRYRDVLARTPWATVPLEERTAANRAMRLLPAPIRRRSYIPLQRARA